MKTLIFVCLFAFFASVALATSYTGFKILEVSPKDMKSMEFLKTLEMDGLIDIHGSLTTLHPVSIMVSPVQQVPVTLALKNNDLTFSVTGQNIQKQIDEERERLANKRAFDVDDFNTLEDIYSQLLVYASNCPSGLTCDVYSIGTTTEDRSIDAIRIGKGNPIIAYDTLIHAREWLTGATTLKMIDNMVNNYGSDSEVTYLLDNYDFLLIPVVNPDGYEYSWTNGNRMWRKNRVSNRGSSCIGVDLNRNFATAEWGKQGSSGTACSDIYHGSSAGSELEVQAVQDEVLRLQDEDANGVLAYVSLHSYSWMWMYPWGYTENFGNFRPCVRTDDWDELYAISELVQDAILESSGRRWDIGTTCEVIYPTTGGTDDWTRGNGGVKYSFAPELRGPGFVVSPDLIQPSFEENWAALMAMVDGIEQNEAGTLV